MMHVLTRRIRSLVVLLIQSVAATAAAQTDTSPPADWLDDLKVNAFVSSAYSYNVNRPASGATSYRVFDFNDNSFNLDVAELVVQIAPSTPRDAGFRLDFAVGNSIPRISKTQDQMATQFDLQQAFASYIAPIGSGLRFDVGKYITHMGYEVIEGYDGYNENYSRSTLFGYAIPFTHTGVKASYAFSSKVAAMVEVVNGWDLLRDNNGAKSLGAQLSLTPVAPLTVLLNWIGGAEIEDDNHTRRSVFDVVVVLKPVTALTLGANADYGIERGTSGMTPGSDATWKGIAGYASVALGKFAIALRGETFHDEDGLRLGTGTRTILSEVTLTPVYRFTDNVLLRGEVRFDKANQPILNNRASLAERQTTVAANMIFVY